MRGTLYLDAGVDASLRAHAARCEPDEACALLLGRSLDGGRGAEVREAFLARNAARSPRRFEVDGGDLLDAYAEAGRRGVDVAAIFHSHPLSEARPSAADEEYMRINPVPWLIYSPAEGRSRAWLLGPEGAEEAGVVVRRGPSGLRAA